MNILYVKAIHIIFVVNWFAGLFYIVRLFIYHTEANDMEEPQRSILQDQYKIMERRLWYIITWPSAIITIVSGLYLTHSFNFWAQPWMHLKLGFVLLLFLYHLKCGHLYRQLKNNVFRLSSTKLRFWNEVATLFLIAIVFTIVLKSLIDWVWGTIGIIGISVILMLVIKWYKKRREKEE